MPYEKTSKEVKDFTSFLPKNAPRKIRYYHFLHNLDHIPRCEFTGENAWFTCKGYQGTNKLIWMELVRHDQQITFKPLQYRNLLRAGAQVHELIALRDQKYFHKIRDDFRECADQEAIFARLQQMGFLPVRAKEILSDIDWNSWQGIQHFVEKYYSLTVNIKNNHIEYYTYRGYNTESANDFRYKLCNTWEKIKSELRNDKTRYAHWVMSRRRGLLAQGRISKKEDQLAKALSDHYSIKTQLCVDISDVKKPCRSLVKNRQMCYVDIVLNDQVFLEFNGMYWHHDAIAKPDRYDLRNYTAQIARLKCIQAASRMRVFVVWENDLLEQGLENIIKRIRIFADSSVALFGSSREIDYRIYESL